MEKKVPEVDEVSISTRSKETDASEKVKDLLTCEICKEIFNEPVTLLCNHTYCQYCIHKLIEQSTEKSKNNEILMSSQLNLNSCPKCMLKIWLPPVKHVNYTLRDVIKTLYGEKEYEEIKKERSIGLIKIDMKDQAMEEIKEEMWRSISDNLNLENPHGPRHKLRYGYDPIDPYYDYDPLTTASNWAKESAKGFFNGITKKKPCFYYNTISGCKLGDGCSNDHKYDDNLLKIYFEELAQKYPFLCVTNCCEYYNSLEGCNDKNCAYPHIYDYRSLCNELARLRKIGFVHPDDIEKPETMIEFGKKMVLIFGILLGTYLWWRMRK